MVPVRLRQRAVPLELYDGYTLAEQRELGELWVSLGAPTEEAMVQYHPLELECLTEGLLDYVERVLTSL